MDCRFTFFLNPRRFHHRVASKNSFRWVRGALASPALRDPRGKKHFLAKHQLNDLVTQLID